MQHETPAKSEPPSPTSRTLLTELERRMSPILARSVLAWSCRRSGLDAKGLSDADLTTIGEALGRSVYLSAGEAEGLLRRVRLRGAESRAVRSTPGRAPAQAFRSERPPPVASALRLPVVRESDVVPARQAVRQLAIELGFDALTVVKLATVVSELARNVFQYAGGGFVEARALSKPRTGIEIVVSDHGPGIADIDFVLSRDYQSRTGMGCGLRGSRNLADEFEVRTRPGGGTVVTARKYV